LAIHERLSTDHRPSTASRQRLVTVPIDGYNRCL
jgi:hypothetical protein